MDRFKSRLINAAMFCSHAAFYCDFNRTTLWNQTSFAGAEKRKPTRDNRLTSTPSRSKTDGLRLECPGQGGSAHDFVWINYDDSNTESAVCSKTYVRWQICAQPNVYIFLQWKCGCIFLTAANYEIYLPPNLGLQSDGGLCIWHFHLLLHKAGIAVKPSI